MIEPKVILMNGDCLEKMALLPDNSVDMVLTDPPYGITECKWDSVVPLEPMWKELKRVCKINGAIVMTSSQPFTSVLITSNLKMYRYNWVWDKGYSTGFANANKMPLRGFEDVCVFYSKLPTYNPQGLIEIEPKQRVRSSGGAGEVMGKNGRTLEGKEYVSTYTNYPNGFIKTKKEKTLHPTGKPVSLMEYLIRTYTNKGETVLDFTMGSGTTGEACVNQERNFIGIERNEEYFQVASNRIQNRIQNISETRINTRENILWALTQQ